MALNMRTRHVNLLGTALIQLVYRSEGVVQQKNFSVGVFRDTDLPDSVLEKQLSLSLNGNLDWIST